MSNLKRAFCQLYKLCALFTAQFAGEDPVVALEAALQFEDTRESMQAFCVGQYMEVAAVIVCIFLL